MTTEQMEKFNALVNKKIDQYNQFAKSEYSNPMYTETLASFVFHELVRMDLEIKSLEKRMKTLNSSVENN